MKKRFLSVLLLSVLISCGQEIENTPNKEVIDKKQEEVDSDHPIKEKQRFSNGIVINWFEKGTGSKLKDGDLIKIDFKVKLKDGKIVDGNHFIKKDFLPFLVGFNQQTPGWDFALKEMQVGDYAKILIPSKLARGDKGIEGLIPPNSDNLLYIKILGKINPDRVVDDTKVWILEENKSNKLKFNEKTKIIFHGIAGTPTNPAYVNTFRINQPFTYRLSDNGLVPGLRKALINAKKSDKLYILVPSQEAYGAQGYLDVVKPNEPVFYDILVMDVSPSL